MLFTARSEIWDLLLEHPDSDAPPDTELARGLGARGAWGPSNKRKGSEPNLRWVGE